MEPTQFALLTCLAVPLLSPKGKAMEDIQRFAKAQWSGDLPTGKGKINTGSGALQDANYTFTSRFERGKGTNPEELIAAAQASCFSMMLTKVLTDMQKPPSVINTQATITLRRDPAQGFTISSIALETQGAGEGLDEATFKKAADEAKEKCPVSRLLKPGLESLTVEARLL
jgi:lipoyl-dependent peroxiredoxin